MLEQDPKFPFRTFFLHGVWKK